MLHSKDTYAQPKIVLELYILLRFTPPARHYLSVLNMANQYSTGISWHRAVLVLATSRSSPMAIFS